MVNREYVVVRFTVAILLTLSTGRGQINIAVRGTVSDPYGYPAFPCDVRIARMVDGGVTHYSASALAKSETSENGSYSIAVNSPGIFKLVITYPFAQRIEIPLILSALDTSITCDVRLGEVEVDSLSSFVAVGSWNTFSFRYADTLVCSDDGSFRLRRSVDTTVVRFAIFDINRYPLITPILPLRNVKIWRHPQVEFVQEFECPDGLLDLSMKLHREVSVPWVKFDADHSWLTELFRLSQGVLKQRTRFAGLNNRYKLEESQKHGSDFHIAAFRELLYSIMTNPANDDILRRFAAVSLVQPFYWGEREQITGQYGMQVLSLVKPNDEIWSVGGAYAFEGVSYFSNPRERNNILREFAETNPERVIRGMALYKLAENAFLHGDTTRSWQSYIKLAREYADVKELDPWIGTLRYQHFGAIRPGGKVPAFTIDLVEGGSISSEDLKGRYYLIDFWASWCAPCLVEIDSLHALYPEIRDRCEVVCVALDLPSRVEHVKRVRGWEMPWYNSIVSEGLAGEIARLFEVNAVPASFLVDPSGSIVALGDQARGANLHSLLRKITRDAP